MPAVPVPTEVEEFLSLPHPAVIATIRPDGSPHSVATWYLWESGRALLNMDASRLRLSLLRRDPRASLTVLDREAGTPASSLSGGVFSIEEAPALAGIARLARHYTGKPFGRRQTARVNA